MQCILLFPFSINHYFFSFLKMQNFYKGQGIVTLKRNHLRHSLNTISVPKLPYLSPEYMYTNMNIKKTQVNWIHEWNSHSSAHTERSHAYKRHPHWSCWSQPCSLFPFMYRAKWPLQGNTTCHLTAQHLYSRELLQQGYHRHTFSYEIKGMRWDLLYSNWIVGRNKGFFFFNF